MGGRVETHRDRETQRAKRQRIRESQRTQADRAKGEKQQGTQRKTLVEAHGTLESLNLDSSSVWSFGGSCHVFSL